MGKETARQTPGGAAKKKMDAMMPKTDSYEGLISAEEQNLQERTRWVEVGNKRYKFVGETKAESIAQQEEFKKLVRKGVKPQEAYAQVTGAPAEVKKLKPAEIKKAYGYIQSYNGKELAKLLGYSKCEDVIERMFHPVIKDAFQRMGFEDYQADNAYKVIYDGTRPYHEVKPDNTKVPMTQVAWHKKFGAGQVRLETAESYARGQMTETELAELKAKEAAKKEREEAIASAQAANDLF